MESIEEYVEILLNAAQDLPSHQEVSEFMLLVEQAQIRGYFYPNEDEQIREVYLRYLSIRQNLWELLSEIQSELKSLRKNQTNKESTKYLSWFTLGFAVAFVLMRAAHYLVTISDSSPHIRSKLDEAEPLYGIGWGSFSEIYRNMRSSKMMLPFRQAVRFYWQNQQAIQSLGNELPQSSQWQELLSLFDRDEGLLTQTKLDYIKRRLIYRQYQSQTLQNIFYRKAMYRVFKLTGSKISDLKDPTVRSNAVKRVTSDIKQQAADLLQPGDFIITRHDDAMSNLFLPGFWPHAALYIGTEQERSALGLEPMPDAQDHINILEAKKDGVKLRNLDETLSVDSFVIFRSQLDEFFLKQALQRALQHRGKKYDFLFDFSMPQRLVCTEVIYRGFHGVADIEFTLSQRSGRYCLSAEDLMNQCVAAAYFEPVAIYGVKTDELVREAQQVKHILKHSYESTWND